MENQAISPKILEQLGKLEQKFQIMGQDMSSYLDGLLYANYLTYWDYIHLDTLLSLQNPKTPFGDEKIFIVYHQITELYFNLVLHEMEQIASQSHIEEEWFWRRLRRMNRYMAHLVGSFDIMVGGMEQEQFLKFRMSLLPASGFQSVQYRLIEIGATDLHNLVANQYRQELPADSTIEEMFDKIYWKYGATELATGQKTLTLVQFEQKYAQRCVQHANEYRHKNLWQVFERNFKDSQRISEALRQFDALVNVDWPLSHLGSAIRYLQKDPQVISATGGTNWQNYLPPKFQKRIFFPEIWSETEKEEWGRQWVTRKLQEHL